MAINIEASKCAFYCTYFLLSEENSKEDLMRLKTILIEIIKDNPLVYYVY